MEAMDAGLAEQLGAKKKTNAAKMAKGDAGAGEARVTTRARQQTK